MRGHRLKKPPFLIRARIGYNHQEMATEELTAEEVRLQRAKRRRARKEKQRQQRLKAQKLAGRNLRSGPEARCRAKTRAFGEPCPMYRAILEHPETGKLYRAATCYAHLPPKVREMFQAKPFGGKVPGTGGPRPKPRVNDVLKQMIEQEITAWLQPLFEALHAEKPVVVGNGRHARVELLPDHRTRLQAVESVLDRIYGKPKQTTELTGADGGPVEVQVPTDKNRALEVAQILAEAGAVDPKAAATKTAKSLMAARAAETN